MAVLFPCSDVSVRAAVDATRCAPPVPRLAGGARAVLWHRIDACGGDCLPAAHGVCAGTARDPYCTARVFLSAATPHPWIPVVGSSAVAGMGGKMEVLMGVAVGVCGFALFFHA